MKPAPGSKVADFRRVDFTTYNDLQGRWQYVVMDTRAPVGLMFAQGMDGDEGQGMTVYFADFPAPTGLVPNMDGRYMRARHVLTRESDDREVARQYWRLGAQPEWLGIQYEYTRTRTP